MDADVGVDPIPPASQPTKTLQARAPSLPRCTPSPYVASFPFLSLFLSLVLDSARGFAAAILPLRMRRGAVRRHAMPCSARPACAARRAYRGRSSEGAQIDLDQNIAHCERNGAYQSV